MHLHIDMMWWCKRILLSLLVKGKIFCQTVIRSSDVIGWLSWLAKLCGSPMPIPIHNRTTSYLLMSLQMQKELDERMALACSISTSHYVAIVWERL